MVRAAPTDGKSPVVKAVDLKGIAGGWIAMHKDLDGVAGTGAYWPITVG